MWKKTSIVKIVKWIYVCLCSGLWTAQRTVMVQKVPTRLYFPLVISTPSVVQLIPLPPQQVCEWMSVCICVCTGWCCCCGVFRLRCQYCKLDPQWRITPFPVFAIAYLFTLKKCHPKVLFQIWHRCPNCSFLLKFYSRSRIFIFDPVKLKTSAFNFFFPLFTSYFHFFIIFRPCSFDSLSIFI